MYQDVKKEKMLYRRAEGTRVVKILKKIQESLENENAQNTINLFVDKIQM